MTLYNSKIWLSDLDEVIATVPELSELEGKHILMTGATGLICSALTDIFIRYNRSHQGTIHIMAAGRSEQKIMRRFGEAVNEPWFEYAKYDATSGVITVDKAPDYIVHGAGNASPDMIVKEPVETMMANIMGLRNLLELARNSSVKRLLYISSSEVYGRNDSDRPFRPDEYGYVDILKPRSSYPSAKRAAETLCAAYAAEYDADTVIVRPGHIYGPTASEKDARVSSAWAYAAARGEDIVMKSDGMQLRSYCHCLDCASAMIKVLLRGQSGTAYNISNSDSVITISEMAQILSQCAGVQLLTDIPSNAERRAFNPMPNSSLDATELMELGWKGMFDARRGFEETVRVLRGE